MSPSPTRHRIALALALLGVGLSALTLNVSLRLEGGAYTSFCNLGPVVNCDVVLTSRYSKLFGVPMAGWALLTFLLGAAFALPGALGFATGGLADLLLLGIVSWSVGSALVLVGAMVALGHVCLLCASIDATILAWFVTVVPLAARFPAPGRPWWGGAVGARAVAALAAVLAIAGGTWAATRAPATATSIDEVRARDPDFYAWYTSHPVAPVRALEAGEHTKGPADAPVCIVEFSDFQCPHCAQAFHDLRALLHARPDVRVVFRYFPLDPACNPAVPAPLHANACLASCAAECAGQQGRFWDYHDVLFENQDHLERESLFRYAREMKLDLNAFRECLDDPATRARVDADVEAGIRLRVNQTPTLLINGRVLPGLREPIHYQYAVIIEKHEAARGAS